MQKNKVKAVIAFYDSEGRLLLQDRHGISGAGEEWGFFGGSIEAGETPAQALAREIKEELGVEVGPFEFIATYKVYLFDGASYNEIYLYAGPLGNLLEHAKQAEGRDMKLYPLSEARQLIMNRTDIDTWKLIKRYLKVKKVIK